MTQQKIRSKNEPVLSMQFGRNVMGRVRAAGHGRAKPVLAHWHITDLSRLIHDRFFDDASMSLCARAYDRQSVSLFWWCWLCIFGEAHCRQSWLWHCEQHWPEG